MLEGEYAQAAEKARLKKRLLLLAHPFMRRLAVRGHLVEGGYLHARTWCNEAMPAGSCSVPVWGTGLRVIYAAKPSTHGVRLQMNTPLVRNIRTVETLI